MAQSDLPSQEPLTAADNNARQSLWRRMFGQNGAGGDPDPPRKDPDPAPDDDPRAGLIRRVSRKVVPGLPRAQTFKRQRSELRDNLEPVQQTPAERRTLSVDRRLHASQVSSQCHSDPRSSAPEFVHHDLRGGLPFAPSLPPSPSRGGFRESIDDVGAPDRTPENEGNDPDAASIADEASMTTSRYDAMIHEELERRWILNLSMHFRDKSKREKFFVTYREKPTLWRRVTISLDYRDAPENSLEIDLLHTKFQRDKSAKIYEAIRESLVDIQFYDSVTNLKLQTTDGRLHVHVVEDVNEIVHFPTVRMIQHLGCRRVKESEIDFDSHMSGFVYKVRVDGETLIKKEIPGPDTVDEFLYEINALSRLRYSHNVIHFYGVIVDDSDEHVKGLLISYAEQGALIDVIFDNDHTLPWPTREKWARQIVEGLADIHEAGFVQGDFTLSNIVIDHQDNAKIIDINRRGCPVGWEPPEATPLIESNQRISMYIGVKSDLYQLGMVLWALALQDDEPESHGRPLVLGPEVAVPHWYKTVVETCLAEDPRLRAQAVNLLGLFPDPEISNGDIDRLGPPSISVDDGTSVQEYFVEGYHANGHPRIRTVQPRGDWPHGLGHTYVDPVTDMSNEPYYFPTRGRSPPRPSNSDQPEPPRYSYRTVPAWTSPRDSSADVRSVSEGPPKRPSRPDQGISATPKTSKESVPPSDTITSSRANETLCGPSPETAESPQVALKETGAEAPFAEAPGGDTPTAVEPSQTESIQPLEEAHDLGPAQQAAKAAQTPEPVRPPREPARELSSRSRAQSPGNPSRESVDARSRQGEPGAPTVAEPTAGEEGGKRGEEEAAEKTPAATEEPLFDGAGTTAPAVQNHRLERTTSSLAPSGAENQEAESASREEVVFEEREERKEGNPGAGAGGPRGVTEAGEEPGPPSRPASARSSPTSFTDQRVPNELKGCGSAWDLSDEETMRHRGVIDDEDVGGSAASTTATPK